MFADLPVLTKRQESVLVFIKKHMDDESRPPTIREIGEFFSIASPNGVMCHLKALEKKGYIRRTYTLARAITLDHSLPLLGRVS